MHLPRSLSRRLPLLALPAALLLGSAARADVLAHWSFDELSGRDGKTFVDSTGKYNALIDDKSQVTIDSSDDVHFKNAASFSGSTGGTLDIPRIVPLRNSSFTIAVWVKLDGNDSSPVIADWYKPDFSFNFGFESKNGGEPHIAGWMHNPVLKGKPKEKRGRPPIPPANTDILKSEPAINMPTGSWHHVAWVWDRIDDKRGKLSAYLDGKRVFAVDSNPKLTTVNLQPTTHPWRIGFRSDPPHYFHGDMDELWVFDNALTAEQISNLMKSNDIEGTQVAEAPKAETSATHEPASPGDASTPAPEPSKPAVSAAPAPATPAPSPTPPAHEPVPPVEKAPEPVATRTPAHTETPPPKPAESAGATPAAPSFNVAPAPKPSRTASAGHSAPAAPSSPNEPTFTFNAKSSPTIPPAPANTVAQTRSRGYSSMRVLGLIASGGAALFLSGFLLWAVAERSRIHR